jgi:putative membrane protein
MFLEISIALAFGVAFGIITGLAPGIHVNLVAAALLSLSPILLEHLSPLSLGVFIMALAVTHSYHDTIPSVYLGAPENENSLSVLPGQKMLLQGHGYQAVKITILGTYSGMLLSFLLIPLFLAAAGSISPVIKPYLPYMLIFFVVLMIMRESDKFWSALLFLLSGTMGLIVFSMSALKEPLFPMLSGLFGVSGLLISLSENSSIVPQKTERDIDLDSHELAKALSGSAIGVFLIQFFPGLGPAHGAVMASQVIKKMKDRIYLALVGAMGTMSVIFSLVTFYSLDKAKDGSIVVLSKLIEIDLRSFLVLLSTMLVAGSISVFLVLSLSKRFSKVISMIDYRKLIIAVIASVMIICLLISGWQGILVLLTATCIGLIAPLKSIGRSHAMGCLLLPVILYLIL